jgi:steroid delta-isomerase-like uncharacterized protein
MSKLTVRVGLCLIAGVTLLALVACQAHAPAHEPAPDYAAQLGPAADSFIEAWNTKEYDKLDGIASADYRRRAPDQDADGLAAMKEFMGQVHTTYPDFHIGVNEAYYQENLAIVVWTVTGTNTGEGAFPPTGERVDVEGVTMLRFADGKIVEEVVFYDTATVTEQLGLAAVPHATP